MNTTNLYHHLAQRYSVGHLVTYPIEYLLVSDGSITHEINLIEPCDYDGKHWLVEIRHLSNGQFRGRKFLELKHTDQDRAYGEFEALLEHYGAKKREAVCAQ